MRPPLPGAGRISVFVRRTRTVLPPWCSLTSYSYGLYYMYYNILSYTIILHVFPEYDVKLLQGGRTVRIFLKKRRYAPTPVMEVA